MSESSSDVNPLDALAEEFTARHRAGEEPSLDEFIARRPDLADDIRDLFPGLVLMEGVRPERADSTGPFAPGPAPALKRLGDFRILREVGRGGMGVVYEAEQESLGRHVALKVLPAHALLDPQRLRRFQREAKAAARLHHTNIVPVYGVGEQDGLHYYVMQFIQGQGLDQVLDELKALRRKRQGTAAGPVKHTGAESAALSLLTGRFASGAADEASPVADAPGSPAAEAPGKAPESSGRSDTGRAYWGSVARIGIQTAQALAYAAGQGTLHRDVKPSNLLLDAHGNLWVTDFGLAKAADSEDLTHTGDIVGTLRYMAPERFSGKGDLRSDLYSIGLTLYELLALRPAFEAPDRQQLVHQVLHAEPPRLRQLDRAVPRDLETIVHKAIDRDPARRYQAAEDLADDLHRFLDDRPIRARRVGAVEKLWRWARRNPLVAGLSAAVALLLVASSIGGAVAAYHFRMLAADERKAHADADAARRDADDNAGRLRDRMAALYEVNALMESGRAHEAAGDWEKAHAGLTKAIERMPEYALVWRERAELYYRLGLEEEALADLDHVFELKEPAEPELWLRYAGLRLQQSDEAGYRTVCSRMGERFDNDDKTDPIWHSLACCLGPNALGDPEGHVKRMQKAIERAGASWRHKAVLAAVFYRAGQVERAVKQLRELGDLGEPLQGPNIDTDAGAGLLWTTAALINRGNRQEETARRLLGYVDNRREAFSRGLVTWIGTPDEQWYHIEVVEAEPLYREAAEAVRGAEHKEPPGAWKRRAEGHQRIGQKRQAADDLTEALRSKPDDLDLLLWRAKLFSETAQRDRSDADLARFVASKSPSLQLWVQACEIPTAGQDWDAGADLACQALDCVNPMVGSFHRAYLVDHAPVLSRVAQRRPDDFALRFGCAGAFLQRAQYAEVVEWATQALRLKPDDAEALTYRAVASVQLTHWQDAAEDFDHLSKVRPPQTADDLMPLALLRAYLGDRDGYRQVCGRMADQFGKDPKAVWAVADALSLAPNDAADPVKTQQQLGRLLQPPGRGEWPNYVTYALASVRAGKPEEALHALLGPPEKAGVPGPAAFLIEALASHRLGRADKARAYLDNANHVAEPSAWGDALRFRILLREADAAINAPDRKEAEECLRNKQWKEAVGHLDALLKADPDFWPDLMARSVAYGALGEQEKADADLKRAVNLSSGSPYSFWARGRLYAAAGMRDLAAFDYAVAVHDLQPDDKHPAAEVTGPRQELCTELTQDESLVLAVAARYPDDFPLRLELGHLLKQQGKWKPALVLFHQALRLRPGSLPLRLECGRLAAEHEQWADAASDLKAAYEAGQTNPNTAEVGYEAALLLLEAGDADGYRQICRSLQKNLDGNPSSPDIRTWFVWSCIFGPDAVADFEAVIKLADDDKAVLAQEWGRLRQAALRYRAGKFKEANGLFDDMPAGSVMPDHGVKIWLFRAMTYQCVGRPKDAAFWLQKATNWMGDDEQAKLPAGQRIANWPWNQRLELTLLRREAEAVVRERPPKPEK
jgi:serine/threonine protein kinase/Tfp pilus assembly protein PilF